MLLMNINVARTTDTTVMVEFKGNDLITVRMSADPVERIQANRKGVPRYSKRNK